MFDNVNIDWHLKHPDDGSTDFSDDETLDDPANASAGRLNGTRTPTDMMMVANSPPEFAHQNSSSSVGSSSAGGGGGGHLTSPSHHLLYQQRQQQQQRPLSVYTPTGRYNRNSSSHTPTGAGEWAGDSPRGSAGSGAGVMFGRSTTPVTPSQVPTTPGGTNMPPPPPPQGKKPNICKLIIITLNKYLTCPCP